MESKVKPVPIPAVIIIHRGVAAGVRAVKAPAKTTRVLLLALIAVYQARYLWPVRASIPDNTWPSMGVAYRMDRRDRLALLKLYLALGLEATHSAKLSTCPTTGRP